jgi:hypothetical protein
MDVSEMNEWDEMQARLAKLSRAELLSLTEQLMAVMQAHGLAPDSMDESHAASWHAAEADFLAQTGFAMDPVLDVMAAIGDHDEAELTAQTEALARLPHEQLFALWQVWLDLLADRGLTQDSVDHLSPDAWTELETSYAAQAGHPFEALLGAIAQNAPPAPGSA